jgi:hypothetical protein
MSQPVQECVCMRNALFRSSDANSHEFHHTIGWHNNAPSHASSPRHFTAVLPVPGPPLFHAHMLSINARGSAGLQILLAKLILLVRTRSAHKLQNKSTRWSRGSPFPVTCMLKIWCLSLARTVRILFERLGNTLHTYGWREINTAALRLRRLCLFFSLWINDTAWSLAC